MFRRIIPRFWQRASFRSAKGFGAADELPVSRDSLMVFKVRCDIQKREEALEEMAERRESTIMEVTYSSTGSLSVLVVTGFREEKSTAFWIPGW